MRQFTKFAVVGFGSFLLDAMAYTLFRRVGFIPEICKALSFAIAASFSYYFNRRWTFRSDEPKILHQYAKFLVVALIGLGLNTVSFSILLRQIGLPETGSFIGAAAIVMFWNFFANKLWTFRRS